MSHFNDDDDAIRRQILTEFKTISANNQFEHSLKLIRSMCCLKRKNFKKLQKDNNYSITMDYLILIIIKNFDKYGQSQISEIMSFIKIYCDYTWNSEINVISGTNSICIFSSVLEDDKFLIKNKLVFDNNRSVYYFVPKNFMESIICNLNKFKKNYFLHNRTKFIKSIMSFFHKDIRIRWICTLLFISQDVNELNFCDIVKSLNLFKIYKNCLLDDVNKLGNKFHVSKKKIRQYKNINKMPYQKIDLIQSKCNKNIMFFMGK